MRKVVIIALTSVLLLSALVGCVATALLPNEQQESRQEMKVLSPNITPSTVSESNQPELSETPYVNPYLDHDYDDSWVANIPDVIGGYKVIRVTTPKEVAGCHSDSMITFQAPRKTLDEFLSAPVDMASLRAAVLSIEGVPPDVRLSFANAPRDEEEYAENLRRRNEIVMRDGCIFQGRVVDPDTSAVSDDGSGLSDVERP